MICGLSNGNIVDPTALNEDWSSPAPVNSAEDCYQLCLSMGDCKSYFTSEYPDGSAWNCAIFRNTLKGMLFILRSKGKDRKVLMSK